MADHSCRFNVVTQLSETVLERILRELQDAGAFPKRWQGRKALNAAPLDMELGFGFDIELSPPTLATESGDAAKLSLGLDFRGVLRLDARIDSRPPVGASAHDVPVPFHGSVAAAVPLQLARRGTYGYLELATRELRDVAVHVRYDDAVGGNGPLYDRLIQRILLVQLHGLSSIPISHGFELETTTGWEITNHTIRIIDGPSPPDRDDVTIAMNTWPNRFRGRRADLHDWVNPGSDIAICYDERFLAQAVARAVADDRIPREYDDKGCPQPGGPIQLQDATVNLNDGALNVFIEATRHGAAHGARGQIKLQVDPGDVVRAMVVCDAGSASFLRGVSHVLLRAVFAVADLETFADPDEPDRDAAYRDRVFSAARCGTDLSAVLQAPVPTTTVSLRYRIQRIDVTANEVSTCGQLEISHT